jgi:hypothetical protein
VGCLGKGKGENRLFGKFFSLIDERENAFVEPFLTRFGFPENRLQSISAV